MNEKKKKKLSDDCCDCGHSKQYSWNRNNMQTDIHIYILKKIIYSIYVFSKIQLVVYYQCCILIG